MLTSLTESELKLLTASVDEELSPADAQLLAALLAVNPDAAEVARQLRSDAARLRRLPKRAAPAGLVPKVLVRLSAREPQIAPRPAARSRRAVWLPYAVAASALFTVTTASFWFFAALQERDRQRELTARGRFTAPLPDPTAAPSRPRPPLPPDPDPVVAVLPDVLPQPREVVEIPRLVREVALAPRPVVGDFVGAGIVEPAQPLHALELRLPFVGTPAEFALEDARARFASGFASEAALRVDLFTRNLPAGAEQLVAAARAAGVTVSVDSSTQDRLGKKVPVAYALLVEGLTLRELGELLGGLAKPPQPAVTAIHAYAAGEIERKEWKDVFGRELGLFRSARSDPQSPVRPISDGTLGKLKNTVGKNPDKAGLVLTYLSAARSGSAMSKEIKAFLDGRGERKAGTATAVFVVRPPAN